METYDRKVAYWVAVIVFAVIFGYLIGTGYGDPGTAHFVVWLASVTAGGFALRRYLFPGK